MAQQINLIDPRLLPRTVAFGGTHALWAAVAVLAVGTAAGGTMQVLAGRTTADTRVLQQRAAQLTASASAPPTGTNNGASNGSLDTAAELDQLRRLEAGQRRIRAALEAGVAGEREGPADYFKALARQAHGSVWITGFAVADNGSALEIEGRMTETELLPDYLRRLNQEPRFKGRSFAQLSLNGVERITGNPLPYTEFALRSRPPTGSGR